MCMCLTFPLRIGESKTCSLRTVFLHPSLYSDVTALKAGQWKLVLLLACYVRSMSNNCLYTVVFLVKDRKQVQEGRKG